MNKTAAIQLFGGKQRDLARALNITQGAISQWPEQLTQRQIDLVMGAALRLGRVPCECEPAQTEQAA